MLVFALHVRHKKILCNQQPATSMNDVLYISREQELLACLRDAQFAAAIGNIDSVLKMQANIYQLLSEIVGEQTQQVLRLWTVPLHKE
jgi:hypothetical protein